MRSALILMSILSIHKGEEWTPLFDGSTLDGWKANNPSSWTIKDGVVRGDGNSSLLVYQEEKCVNCEIKADVRISKAGSATIYLRAGTDPSAQTGYEAHITAPASSVDNTWFTEDVLVEGNHFAVYVNGKKTVDYIDENNRFTGGSIVLQTGDGGAVEFKNVVMKDLPKPSTVLSGTWKLDAQKSKPAAGTPADKELRILDERTGLRWQSLGDNGKLEGNFFGRDDGYNYRVTGTPLFDHISLQEVDKHQVHLAMRTAKLRKKLDPHTYVMEMEVGRESVGSIIYTVSADGKTLTAEGSWKHGKNEPTPFTEVFERVD